MRVLKALRRACDAAAARPLAFPTRPAGGALPRPTPRGAGYAGGGDKDGAPSPAASSSASALL